MAAMQDHRIVGCVDKVIQEALERGIERFSCNGCCEDDWDQVSMGMYDHLGRQAGMEAGAMCTAQVKQLSLKYPCITPNFGLHPWCEPSGLQGTALLLRRSCSCSTLQLTCRWVASRSEGWLDRLRHALIDVPAAGLGEVLTTLFPLPVLRARLHIPETVLRPLQCGLDHARQGAAEMPVQEQAFRQQLQLGKELQRPISVRELRTCTLLLIDCAIIPVTMCMRQVHCVKAFGALQDILERVRPG